MTQAPFDPSSAPAVVLAKAGEAALQLRGEEGIIGAAVGPGITTLNHRFVSQRHVHWQRVEEGAILVRDLGSKNGTWLGDEPLGPEPRRLALGGRLNLAREGEWVLQSSWTRGQTMRKLPGLPVLRFHEYTNREVKVEILINGHELLALRGNRGKLLFLLAEKAHLDAQKDLAPGSIGWYRRDKLFAEMWDEGEYDYRLLGRVLHETRTRITDEGLEDVFEARDAPTGRRAQSQGSRIGSLRLRRDGAWIVDGF